MPATVRTPRAQWKSCSRMRYPRIGDIAILDTHSKFGTVYTFSFYEKHSFVCSLRILY